MMFALPPGTPGKLVHVNVRGEFHGADTVPQADLRFEVALSNFALEAFDPLLRTCLYKPGPDSEPELEAIEPVTDTPALRFPSLAMPIKWEDEGTGYTLTVETLLGAGAPLVLMDCKVGAIRLDCMDGGTVGVDFRVSTTHAPDVQVIAGLASLVQRTVRIALAPPVAEPAPEGLPFPEPEPMAEDS